MKTFGKCYISAKHFLNNHYLEEQWNLFSNFLHLLQNIHNNHIQSPFHIFCIHGRTHSPHKLIAHRMKDNDQSFLITGLFHFFLQHFFNHFR